jgi:hypothetical protein
MYKKLFVYIVLTLFALPLYASADTTTTCSYDYFAQKVVCTTTPDFQQQQEQKRRDAQAKLDGLKFQYGATKYYACLPPASSLGSDPYVMESTYQQTKYCLEKQAITNSRPPAPSPSPNNEIPQSVTNEALCILGNKQYCKNNPLPAPVVPTPAPKVIPPPAANWTTDSTCKNSYGLNARADMAGCKCNDGYIFNTAGTACVLAQSQSVPTKNIAPKPPKVEAQPKVESAQDTQPANQANIETPQTVQPPVEEKMQVLPQAPEQEVEQPPVEKPGVFKRFWRWLKKLF